MRKHAKEQAKATPAITGHNTGTKKYADSITAVEKAAALTASFLIDPPDADTNRLNVLNYFFSKFFPADQMKMKMHNGLSAVFFAIVDHPVTVGKALLFCNHWNSLKTGCNSS